MFGGVFICLLIGSTAFGTKLDQVWNYTTVRPSAHLFWWLHYTTADVMDPTERPLFVWLQGGPGSSSTGFGNYGEIGPLDADLNPRNTTWVQFANVLFVDNPVGCGFSYVDNKDALTTNNTQIATDFIQFLKQFYELLPEFIPVPLYIFGESYGGKMAAEIALSIHKEIKSNNIKSNLTGVVFGDSWISPVDSVLTWAPYLFNLGLVDNEGYKLISNLAKSLEEAFNNEEYKLATDYWFNIEYVISELTGGVNFNNVLTKKKVKTLLDQSDVDSSLKKKLSNVMNGEVKEYLNVSTHWSFINQTVFIYLYNDFMKPVTDVVEEILNTTDIRVTVYNGQLDLIVDTPGTVKWIDNLKFPGKKQWNAASRRPFNNDGHYEGYVKKSGNLALYWVSRSGHFVPVDNPSAMNYILKEITNNFTV